MEDYSSQRLTEGGNTAAVLPAPSWQFPDGNTTFSQTFSPLWRYNYRLQASGGLKPHEFSAPCQFPLAAGYVNQLQPHPAPVSSPSAQPPGAGESCGADDPAAKPPDTSPGHNSLPADNTINNTLTASPLHDSKQQPSPVGLCNVRPVSGVLPSNLTAAQPEPHNNKQPPRTQGEKARRTTESITQEVVSREAKQQQQPSHESLQAAPVASQHLCDWTSPVLCSDGQPQTLYPVEPGSLDEESAASTCRYVVSRSLSEWLESSP